MTRIDRLAELSAADRDAIVAPLDIFSIGLGYLWAPMSLAFALRDGDGRIIGGLIGEVQWEWLHVRVMAVAEEHRHGGWGRRLVEEAERAAVTAGCHSAWVDTFSFQSPGFYERLGYTAFGELPEYPAGQKRIFLCKRLVSAGPRQDGRT